MGDCTESLSKSRMNLSTYFLGSSDGAKSGMMAIGFPKNRLCDISDVVHPTSGRQVCICLVWICRFHERRADVSSSPVSCDKLLKYMSKDYCNFPRHILK